jgi:hypothetical protein
MGAEPTFGVEVPVTPPAGARRQARLIGQNTVRQVGSQVAPDYRSNLCKSVLEYCDAESATGEANLVLQESIPLQELLFEHGGFVTRGGIRKWHS